MATKRGKILNKKDPLNPRKGEIRLLSISDPKGGISVRDLRKKPLSNEEREILESRELIAHNAAFELRFLGTKYGIVPRQVFCTMTASKLLLPGRVHAHNLKAVIERHLGVDIPKELGTSHWGGFVLTEEQMEYARNDVRYLHQLKDKLAKELEAAGLTKVFEMERRLLLVTAAMEVHGFSVNIEAMRALKEEADRISGDLAVS